MRVPLFHRLSVPCALLLAQAGAACQTSPASAPQAPPPAPTSIAVPAGIASREGWTTPAAPEATPAPGARLERRAAPGGQGPFDLGPVTKKSEVAEAIARAGGGAPGEVDLATLDTTGPWEASFSLGTTFLRGGTFDNGEGGVDTWRHAARLRLSKPLPHFGRFGWSVGYELHDYDFGGPSALFGGSADPFGLVHVLTTGVSLFQPVSESVAIVLNASTSASAEVGADLGDALAWSVTAGGGYRASEELDIGGGVYVAGRFEEDLIVFGGPQFTWRPSERWRLALEGAQLSASFRPNDAWEWSLAGGFESERFRLRSRAPGLSQIVTDSRLPIWLQLAYLGDGSTELELRVGITVYRDFVVEDANGENGIGQGSDLAPFVALRWIQEL